MRLSVLVVALGLVLSSAILRLITVPSNHQEVLRSFRKPRWAPTAIVAFVCAIATLIVNGFIAYRIGSLIRNPSWRAVALATLAVTMFYDSIRFGIFVLSRSTLVGLLGTLALVGPMTILQLILVLSDPIAAIALAPFLIGVVMVEIPYRWHVWRLNR